MSNYIITEENFRLLSRYVIAKTEDSKEEEFARDLVHQVHRSMIATRDEQSVYNVFVAMPANGEDPKRRIDLIKYVRIVGDLSLGDAKALVEGVEDGTPQQLPLAVTLDWAEEIVRRVKTYGYIATINKV